MSWSYPIGREGVETLLPHRPPALLIHSVESFDESVLHARVTTNPDWNIFDGHFPGRPILPGVILIEMIAQAGALLGGISGIVDEGTFLAFSGVEKARFRRPIGPGETIDIFAELASSRRGLHRFKGWAEVGGQRAAVVEFTAAQMSFEG